MRTARITLPGAQYHVTARITRKEMVFEKEIYKTLLLEYISKAKNKYTFEIYSLCIMGNHFHVIIKPTGDSLLANIMKSILCGFAIRFNKMNGYTGHVWHDRYRSKIIDSMDYFGRTVAYIANNPVRAGIVDHPLKYRFSSITAWERDDLGEQYRKIRMLFFSIVKRPSKEMVSIMGGYLENFDFHQSLRSCPQLSFQSKGPGRPPNIKNI